MVNTAATNHQLPKIPRGPSMSADTPGERHGRSLINLTDGFIVKIASYGNFTLAVLTRNEHCPPHGHAWSTAWDARFKFSFWHDDVCLWDVVPARKAPTARLLESIRRGLMRPANLRKAREGWWRAANTVCLDHLMWQPGTQEVVAPSDARPGAQRIMSARFDGGSYSTILQLEGDLEVLEIEHGKD